VLQASDGSEAWDSLRREPVDAVLADVEMPRMDGLELTRRVRAHPPLAGLPVILISNRGADADVGAGLEAGADAYLRKDQFSQRELGAILGRLLGGKQAAAEALA
jgi:CheY-like chemotaxis protein